MRGENDGHGLSEKRPDLGYVLKVNFFFNFREYFYLFCNLFTLAKLQRGLEKKPQGEDRVHPWD